MVWRAADGPESLLDRGPLSGRRRLAYSTPQRRHRITHVEGEPDPRAVLRAGTAIPHLLDAARRAVAARAARERRDAPRIRHEPVHERRQSVPDLHLESRRVLAWRRGVDPARVVGHAGAGSPAAMNPGERFEELYRAFDHTTSATDPVHIVRRFSTAADREVVGFCAAG